MKIVRPYAKLRQPISGPNGPGDGPTWDRWFEVLLDHVEYCARISHRSEDRITHGSAEKLLKFIVMEKGDFSVIEHSMVTVEFLVDRGITHELVRHRLFSFTQESTRFVNYEKKMPPSFIYPQVEVECEYCLSGDAAYTAMNTPGILYGTLCHGEGKICPYNIQWWQAIRDSEHAYKELIKKGWRPQEARSVFPNALASKIAVTGNLRNWRHFLNMRTSQETHPQFRQVTIPLLKQFQENEFIGWLFEDIVPLSKQSEMQRNMR